MPAMQKYATTQIESQPIRSLIERPAVERAFDFVERIDPRLDDELVRVCEIAAPPFGESARADYIKKRFERIGLDRVRIDEEGNVVGRQIGKSNQPLVVISAHLDTVFPEGTDVTVKRDGERLWAPGISDNASGLVSLVALAETLSHAEVMTEGTICYAATVGEEGEGDLRGVRFLFGDGELRSGVACFVSLDGPGLERITNRALGSRRHRVTVSGPGGHSWGDFGIVNPVHALGRAIARFATYPAPLAPRTSYNIGIIEGGNSVNAIPEQASMTVDIRSVSPEEIDKLESYLHRVLELAVREENAQRSLSNTQLEYRINLVGNRPSGETPFESKLVQTAIECSRALGIETRLDCSSTDSNVPISLGIPAITLGVGGASGNCHSLNEWYESTGREIGLKRLVLLALALAGLAN